MARQEDTELQGRWARMALKMAAFLPLAEDALRGERGPALRAF